MNTDIPNVIRVDMDFCSAPLWDEYANLSVLQFEDVLKPSTLALLEWYRYWWEEHNSNVENESSLYEIHLGNFIKELQILCAKLIKEELPEHQVQYYEYKDGTGFITLEVL